MNEKKIYESWKYKIENHHYQKNNGPILQASMIPPTQILRLTRIKNASQYFVTILFLAHLGLCLGNESISDKHQAADKNNDEDNNNEKILTMTVKPGYSHYINVDNNLLRHEAQYVALKTQVEQSTQTVSPSKEQANEKHSENSSCFFAATNFSRIIKCDPSLQKTAENLSANNVKSKHIQGVILTDEIKKNLRRIESVLKTYIEPSLLHKFLQTKLEIHLVDGDYLRSQLGKKDMDACYLAPYHRIYLSMEVFKKVWKTQDIECILNEICHASYGTANIIKLKRSQRTKSESDLGYPFLDAKGKIDQHKRNEFEIALREAANNFQFFSETYNKEQQNLPISLEDPELYQNMKAAVLKYYVPRKHKVNISWLKGKQQAGLLEVHETPNGTMYKLNKNDIEFNLPGDIWIDAKSLKTKTVDTYCSYVPDNSPASTMKALGLDYLHTIRSFQLKGGSYGTLTNEQKLTELSTDLASYGNRRFLKIFAPLWLNYREKYLEIEEENTACHLSASNR